MIAPTSPDAVREHHRRPLPYGQTNDRQIRFGGNRWNRAMSFDFRKIRYFIAVFEEGSISRAAERENIAQPALSVQIKQLEEELSIQLFERSPQGVQSTPAGQHFYKLCSDLLGDLQAIRQQMLDFGGTVAGAIRVGVMPSVCRGPFATVLAKYSELYPSVDISIVEANSSTLARGVVIGDLDFAIGNRPASQTDLKLHHLFSDRIMLVSGPATNLTPWKPLDLAQVPNLKLILPSSQHSLRRMLDKHIKAGTIRPARLIEIDGLSGTMHVVESSDWSTALPSVAVINDIDTDRFILNPTASPEITSDIYKIHSPDKPLSLPSEKFAQMIHKELLDSSKIIASYY
jgi:LysR family transcriptional regulator, nitrogen assimilation regulatory protein